MPIALFTNYLTGYRIPLYERLAREHGVEVLLYAGGERYVPAWFRDLDRQMAAAAFPARRLDGAAEAFLAAASGRYRAVIAPFAGGAVLPAVYAGARARRIPFVLWASVWAQPRSPAHALALPLTRRIYRHADSVVAYGEHVRRFVAGLRGRDDDVFVAPQAVEPWLFGRVIGIAEVIDFRERHALSGRLVLFTGRLVAEKGIEVLLDAWRRVVEPATLVVIGDGSLAGELRGVPGISVLGPLPREELPVAYAAAEAVVVPSIPTPRFREPWGLVCNEAMLQGTPVLATRAVGAVAGGLVRDGETGIVVAPGDPTALAAGIDSLLRDEALRTQLGAAGRRAVAGYTYDAMVAAFTRALASAGVSRRD